MTVIFYITNNSLNLAKGLRDLYPETQIMKFNPEAVRTLWTESKNLIFIMATGIVVRTIAPFIKGKKTDPAVVVLDEKGRYAISLLSGHLGGANELARSIAEFLGGEAVITTSSDVNGLTAIDLWAKEKGFIIENEDKLPEVARRLIDRGFINVYSEIEIELPPEFKKVSDLNSAEVVITNRDESVMRDALVMRNALCVTSNELINSSHITHHGSRIVNSSPITCYLVVGIGCNSGTSVEEIEDAVRKVFGEKGLSLLSIHSIATIERKASEPGLVEFAKRHDFEIISFTPEELNSILQPSAFSQSLTVFNVTGAYGVAEPAALLASGARELLVSKQKIGNVTVAIAETIVRKSGRAEERKTSELPSFRAEKLYIIGTGPGGIGYIAPRAIEAIKASDIIVGYKTYIELIKDLIKGKEVISTGMTEEVERAKKAVDLAMAGKTVSIISGGDPGIYGMAGLVFEMLRERDALSVMSNELKNIKNPSPITHHPSHINVEVIPGISALNACASRLGAPLMHDFVCISLSDRLTEWSLIEKRLEFAAMGDFVTVLYNPRSKGRPEHINRAREIFLRYRAPETPVGIVRGAMRPDEEVVITNLKDMLNYDIDMETTVIIGNSQTYIIWNNWMITPRGYKV